jgi:hypothetical protein
MVATRHVIGRQRRDGTTSLAALKAAIALALLVVVVIVVGGYGFNWRWTGLSDRITLWDWLQALALPVAIATAPLLWRHRQRMTHRHRATGAAGMTLFTALVFAGYLIPWNWTGFTGNTLWDWLELALLPLVVATSSLWAEVARARRLALGTTIAGGLVLLVLALCGYLVPWSWTGFTGNTAWDWFKLLLLPVLIPTVLVPAANALVTTRLADR